MWYNTLHAPPTIQTLISVIETEILIKYKNIKWNLSGRASFPFFQGDKFEPMTCQIKIYLPEKNEVKPFSLGSI